MSYNFWNDFLDQWRSNPAGPTAPVIGGWTDPNTVPLLNSYGKIPIDFSLDYLPEPWWGNNGIDDLHSVVINSNPGTGNGSLQHYSVPSIPILFRRMCYQDFVANEVKKYSGSTSKPFLLETNKWHYTRRANVIDNALVACKAIAKIGTKEVFRNHLSVELIPWHTPDSTHIQYRRYVLANLKPIYDSVFCFAAERSRKIKNEKLNNKVIIRSTYNKITPILNGLAAIGKTTTRGVSVNYKADTTGFYFKFRFNDPLIKDIEFICIWGATSRNEFPQPYDPVFHDIIALI